MGEESGNNENKNSNGNRANGISRNGINNGDLLEPLLNNDCNNKTNGHHLPQQEQKESSSPKATTFVDEQTTTTTPSRVNVGGTEYTFSPLDAFASSTTSTPGRRGGGAGSSAVDMIVEQHNHHSTPATIEELVDERIFFMDEIDYLNGAGAETIEFYPHTTGGSGDDDDGHPDGGMMRQSESAARLRTQSSASFRGTNGTQNLNGLNYLNFVTYIGQLCVSIIIGFWGVDGFFYTTWEHLEKYETLISPSYFTYQYLYYIILALLGIFAVLQMFMHFSSRSIIQESIGFLYFYIGIFQIGHILFWNFDLLTLAFVCMLGLCLCLIMVIVRTQKSAHQLQQLILFGGNSSGAGGNGGGGYSVPFRNEAPLNSSDRNRQFEEYWAIRFPFLLYCGWAIPMLLLHFTMLFHANNLYIHPADDNGTNTTNHTHYHHYHQHNNHDVYQNQTNNNSTNDNSIYPDTEDLGYFSLQLAANIVSLAILLMVAALFIIFGGPPFAKTDFCIPFVILWFFVGIACRLLHPSDNIINIYGTMVISSMLNTVWFLSGAIVCMIIPRLIVYIFHNYCTVHVVSVEHE